MSEDRITYHTPRDGWFDMLGPGSRGVYVDCPCCGRSLAVRMPHDDYPECIGCDATFYAVHTRNRDVMLLRDTEGLR